GEYGQGPAQAARPSPHCRPAKVAEANGWNVATCAAPPKDWPPSVEVATHRSCSLRNATYTAPSGPTAMSARDPQIGVDGVSGMFVNVAPWSVDRANETVGHPATMSLHAT